VLVLREGKSVIAKKLSIGEFCEKHPSVGAPAVAAENSRLLAALEKQHERRQKESMGVLSFRDMGGSSDV
jgi:hypothetical protein